MHKLMTALALAATLLTASVSGQEMHDFTGENGTFEVPVAPQRIVVLNDQILALPLWELGATVVGSTGRVDAEGKVFMRGGMDTFGIDFHNTDIAFLGTSDAIDLEAVAALEPDLIIGLPYNDPATIEQLQTIAPTVVIDENKLGFEGTLRTLAELSGKSASFEDRFDRYLANVQRTREYIGNPEEISAAVTFIFPAGESLGVYRTGMGALTRVLDDLGFQQIDAVADIEDTRISISPELIEELDADFIFGFYKHQAAATPEAIFAAYEKFSPGFCQALSACRNNQLVLLPGITFGGTMKSLELALELVEGHVAGRGFIPFEE